MIRPPETSRHDVVDVKRDSGSVTDQTIRIHLTDLTRELRPSVTIPRASPMVGEFVNLTP